MENIVSTEVSILTNCDNRPNTNEEENTTIMWKNKNVNPHGSYIVSIHVKFIKMHPFQNWIDFGRCSITKFISLLVTYISLIKLNISSNFIKFLFSYVSVSSGTVFDFNS